MSVTLRCPNCGTTRATPGECDACHEAQARYFCTNHTPGLWLDGRTCPACGAQFGDESRLPSAPAPPVRTRASADEKAIRGSTLAPWQQILSAILRAGSVVAAATPRRERAALGRGAGGCLGRLLLFIVLLIVAVVVAVVWFGRALLHGMQPY